MKIMITGGLGHIGSALVESIKKDLDLTVVDDMHSQRYCSLFNRDRKFNFWERDFSTISVDELKKFDVIVHLAAITDAAKSMSEKEKVFDVNVTKTTSFIKAAKLAGISLFIFPSSTSVYGKGQDVMYEKDDNVLPQSPYAESKAIIENKLRELSVPHVILRFGTIFGCSKGMRFHTAINKFSFQSSVGQSITVWKQNYEYFRPYLGINDAILSINLAISNLLKINETYNVLTDNFRLSEIVKMIQNIKETKVRFVDTPLLNQNTYFVNDEKIRSMGFSPSDSLESEILKTMEMLG
jgi:nucleoside-diphosphate-sugar epimerase|tara:strand:+ start:1450 stop:2337 length:888 start_codon:yes stop_codon:yes gene_type:complete